MRSISQKLGYIFKDPSLLDLSLTHKSSSSVNNERLEYLGDSLLNFIIADEVFKRFENLTEGSLTQFRASLVSRELLNEMGKEIGLEECVKIGKGETVKGNSILGNTFEALIGAIYLDQGFNIAQKFILNIWKNHIANSEITHVDSKTRLQEYSLKIYKSLPVYKLLENSGPRHKPTFKVAVKLQNSKFITAKGTSKKDAEQKAASLCLDNVLKK